MMKPVRSSRRRFLIEASVTTIAAMTGGGMAGAQTILPDAPAPRRVPTVRSQLGRRRTDHYAWLKHVPTTGQRSLATLPAEVREHLLAENRYAEAMLAPGAAEERALFAAMRARQPLGDAEPELRRGAWRYGRTFGAGGSHPSHYRHRDGPGPRELLLDEDERARGQAYYRTTAHQVSPDGRLFAWAEDVGGNDRHRICVRDIAAGTTRIVVDTDAYGYEGVVFSPSSRWLFWIRRDMRNRPTRVYRTPAAGGPAVLVYEEADPAIFMGLHRTAADGFVAITLSGPDTSEVRLIGANDEEAAPRLVWPRARGRRYSFEEWDGPIAVVEDDRALDGRIVALDPRTFAERRDLVPHRPGVQILQVQPFRSALVRLERRGGLPRLIMLLGDGRETDIAFDGDGYALTLPGPQDFAGTHCRVMTETPVSPPRWLDLDLATGGRTTVATQRVAGLDPGKLEVRRLFAPAADGEMVPITLLTRRGVRPDGTAPLLLYGYGAYGVSTEAAFTVPPTVLVEHGWAYAIAHVRGGSEKGRRWFLDGRRHRKHNSFDDFIACARHLVRTGHAAKGKVVSYGLSAGGLLVAASMNRAPETWAGVIATVPFVDMLNTMSDADHPLVPLFRPDWGDPLSSTTDYDYMASISPYENVKRAAYPPILTTAGLKDDRVGYWEPAKLVAEVRSRSTSRNPAMLLTDMAAGHQGSGGRDDDHRKMARLYAFAMGCVGGRFA